MRPAETRRAHHRKWGRDNRPHPSKNALQPINVRHLVRLLMKLRKTTSALEISRKWGVSRAYIYMICGGHRRPRRMRESTAIGLEALLAKERLAGEAWRVAA